MSTTYTLNAGQIVTESFRKIGNLEPPWTPTADQYSIGLLNLNFMLKAIQTNGPNLFRLTQIQMIIPAGIGYAGNPFQVTPLFLTLADARSVITPAPNLYERPLGVYSYEDYMLLPNKMQTTTSGPSVICFDRQVNASNIYIWPLAASGCVVNATVARTINDILTVNDPIDLPVEWTQGIIWMLADLLIADAGVFASDPGTAQLITSNAGVFYKMLLDFDRPDATFIRPYGKTGNSKIWKY